MWESFEQWLSSDILRDRLQRGPLPLGTPLSEGFDALCAERYQGEPRCNRCPRISSGNHLGSFSTRFSEEPFLITAAAEKLSSLETVDYLRERAERGSAEEFDRIMAKIPSAPPDPGDELPSDERQEENKADHGR